MRRALNWVVGSSGTCVYRVYRVYRVCTVCVPCVYRVLVCPCTQARIHTHTGGRK
jgi:hypothetical protein